MKDKDSTVLLNGMSAVVCSVSGHFSETDGATSTQVLSVLLVRVAQLMCFDTTAFIIYSALLKELSKVLAKQGKVAQTMTQIVRYIFS